MKKIEIKETNGKVSINVPAQIQRKTLLIAIEMLAEAIITESENGISVDYLFDEIKKSYKERHK